MSTGRPYQPGRSGEGSPGPGCKAGQHPHRYGPVCALWSCVRLLHCPPVPHKGGANERGRALAG